MLLFFLTSNVKPNGSFVTKSWIERIVILGISNSPKSILFHAGKYNYSIYISLFIVLYQNIAHYIYYGLLLHEV